MCFARRIEQQTLFISDECSANGRTENIVQNKTVGSRLTLINYVHGLLKKPCLCKAAKSRRIMNLDQ